jgi:transposase
MALRVSWRRATINETELFQAALGLAPPWVVDQCSFSVESGRLDIHLDFPRGSTFPCPECATASKAYDTEDLTWRHLNFFQHQTFLHARTPRVDCVRCGVHRIAVPWARPDSGFTLLYEAFVMQLVKVMPVLAVARLVGEHDTLLWRIVNHYVDSARSKANHSTVTQVGMDETAARRGHDYMALFVDMEERKVLFATPGKDSATVAAFAEDLKAHQGNPEAIKEVSIDMSPAFIKGVQAELPKASITFDKFHVVKLINEAVDEVRRLESKLHPELTGSRYIWLKNPDNLTANQKTTLATLNLPKGHLKTAKAYQFRLAFQDFYLQPPDEAKKYLDKWFFWATHSRIQPIIDVARTIRTHQEGILRWFTSQINNGILEGINSLVQAAKAKARGYRSNRNFASIIYLIAGKLDLSCQPT